MPAMGMRMANVQESQVRDALGAVKYPGFSRDIVSFGLVKEIRLNGGDVQIQIAVTTGEPKVAQQIRDDCLQAVQAVPGVASVNVKVDVQAPAASASGDVGPVKIDGVTHVIAVASGKGGVGKSTVAANLALALAKDGFRVGLCDCDIYGPSVAHMFGGNERPTADEENRIIPVQRYGVQLMSMGFLLDDGSPAVLRGPMVTRYTQQFLRQVAWGKLDYLILDLPPGTGDIQLTIVQTVALSGAVIVTTPQEVALIDARKAIAMFAKTNVPVLGIVENMSFFLCPGDGKRYDIFGTGGGSREAARLQVPLLGEIPIEPTVRVAGDTGRPAVASHPDSAAARAFREVAKKVAAHIG